LRMMGISVHHTQSSIQSGDKLPTSLGYLMEVALATQFGHASIKLLDALGVTVSMPVYMNIDDTKTVAALLGEVSTMAQAVDDVTDSKITEVVVSIVGGMPGAGKSTPASTAENERTGLINFSQTGSPYKWGLDIPAIAESKIVGGKIDLTDTEIQNLIT